MPARYRDLLLGALEAGIEAARGAESLIRGLPTAPARRTLVLGAGKAAAEMAAVVDRHLAGAVEGLVVTREGHGVVPPPSRIEVVEAAHPVPDARAFEAAEELLRRAASATEEDQVVFLISGGGSSLLSSPIEGVTRAEKQDLHRQLVRSGIPVQDINCVRRHLSRVKGGRLAHAARRAGLHTFVISDVVGDNPADVASGPTLAQAHAPDRAVEILHRAQVSLPLHVMAAMRRQEPVEPVPHPVEVIASATDALDAMQVFLQERGWSTVRVGDALEGDAQGTGAAHAQLVKRHLTRREPLALLSGGELTVTVRNPKGRGGPNLEYLGGLMLGLGELGAVEALAADSDGVDGTEDNAGGYLAPGMYSAVRDVAPGLLERNLSYDLFERVEGLVVTGPTRTNVNDLRVILVNGR
ncbi:MAG: DUF4147 domain-containing protein [Myxococcota bacterium]